MSGVLLLCYTRFDEHVSAHVAHESGMNRIAIIDDSDINLTLLKALVNSSVIAIPCSSRRRRKPAWCSENLPELIIVDYIDAGDNGIQ